MGFTRTSDPATEPVSQSEAKLHSRIDVSTDDDLVDSLIEAARDWCEKYTHRAFITQTWTLTMPHFPACSYFDLQPNPVSSITSIAYYDANGDSQTLSTDVYQLDTTNAVARVSLKASQSWPTVADNKYNAVVVTFVAGYGAASAVPETVKTAIKFLVKHWYDQREPVVMGNMTNVPMTVESLLNTQKIPLVA